MLTYWGVFTVLALGSMVESFDAQRVTKRPVIGLILALFLIWLMIGSRFQVGADWTGYYAMYERAKYLTLSQIISQSDPGYQLLNWTVEQVGGEFWLVNCLSASIFCWGLWRLASQQPLRWLSLLVAFPYLVVVVAQGYARQGIAIGILMAGLASLFQNHSVIRYALYVGLAASFHRTAVLAFPLALLFTSDTRFFNVILAMVLAAAVYQSFLASEVDRLMLNYVIRRYESQGAGIRVAMNVVPAFIFLTVAKLTFPSGLERAVWRNFSIASLVAFAAFWAFSASTAVDRLSLYLLPLQIVVFGRAPLWFHAQLPGRVAIMGYSAAVMFIWLNFAANAATFVPYRSYLWT